MGAQRSLSKILAEISEILFPSGAADQFVTMRRVTSPTYRCTWLLLKKIHH